MVLSGTNIGNAMTRVSGPSSRRAFVFDPQAGQGGGLVAALGAQGYACADVASELDGLPDRVADVAPDVLLLVEGGYADEILAVVDAVRERHACPVVLFSEDGSAERMRKAIAGGVSSYVVIGVGENRVRSAIDLAFVQFAQTEGLKRELDDARAALSDRKWVERAKGIVMTQRGVNEDEAFRFLQKTAMDRNIRLPEISKQIIDAADLLGSSADVVALGVETRHSPDPLTAAATGLQPEPGGQRRSGGSDG